MKILVVAHNISSGGAATASRRLIQAFKNNGIWVDLMCIKGDSHPNHLFVNWLRLYSSLLSRLDLYLCKILNFDNVHWQSSGLFGSVTARKIIKKNPDIVNVHWIGHATISIRQLRKLTIPIIVTLHDEWWINSISHYAEKSKNSQNSFLRKKILLFFLGKKRQFLNKTNVKIVAPSNELRKKVANFLQVQENQIYVIPNPISSNTFYPLGNVKKRGRVLLFAGGTQDPRKGFDLLMNVVNLMKEQCEVLVLGKSEVESAGVNKQITIHGVERIDSEIEMNRIYCESSMTLVLSRQEAFGQVASESIMAGTPVTSFKVGGLIDILDHGKNGFLIESFDISLMAKTLDQFLLKNDFDSELISSRAKMRFSEEVVVGAYVKII